MKYIFLFFPFFATSQAWHPNYFSAAFSAQAGAFHGVHEVLQNRNASFMRVFPNASYRFFGPEQWKNKYVRFDPVNGRNKVPIWFTDGLHLSATLTQVNCFASGYSLSRSRRFRDFVLDFSLSFASYSLSNYLVYNVLFK